MLLACLKNQKDSKNYQPLINRAEALVDALQALYADENISVNDKSAELINVIKSLEKLTNEAKPYRSYKITHIISSILGGVTAIVLGLVFGIIGAFVGGIYGIHDFFKENTIKNIGLGFVSGLTIGLVVGFRVPSKLLSKQFTHKIDFCLNNLQRLASEIPKHHSHDYYKQETKQYILNTFFADETTDKNNHDKDDIFKLFLKSEQQFQVSTTTAGHIAKTLKGYLGHHALIIFKINGKQHIPIESGLRKKSPNFVDQCEAPRKVSGEKLFNMLVQDRILQETHKGINFTNTNKIYEIGSDDCLSYVNKILIATDQEPTKITRFSKKTDKLAASKLVAPLISFYSKIKDNELHSLMKEPNAPMFDIESKAWSAKP